MSFIKRALKFAKNTSLKDMPSRLKERNEINEAKRIAREEKMQAIKKTEVEYNVDFGGYIPDIGELGLLEGQCNGYEPSYDMPEIFGYLDVKPGDRLLDVGCGKGYAMYLFSGFPFSEIHGVELSERLADIAEDNLSKLFPNEKERFHIYRENALEFDKLDDYNYIYMYNPFPPEIVGLFAEKLKESAKRCPRKLTVIYQNPQKGSTIENGDVFRLVMYKDGTALFESN